MRYILKLALALFTLLFATAWSLHAQASDSSGITIATTRVLHSTILGEDRKLYIHSPAKTEPGETYPVIYLLDGEAQIEMIAGQLIYLSESYKLAPQAIVVGIANTERVRDLTPTHSIIGSNGKPDTSARAFGRNSGGGEKFIQFIKDELMPYIGANYPANSFKILSGHSLGGLMAIYCLVHHPDYFNAYIAMSPSMQWDNKKLLSEMGEKSHHKLELNKFLFVSSANEDSGFHQNILALDAILKTKTITGLKYQYMQYPAEDHVASTVKASYDAIRFIYPDWYMPYSKAEFRQTMTASIVKEHYQKLSKTYGYNVVPPQDEINAVGRFLRGDTKRVGDAIELFEMNAKNYPSSAAVYEQLGDTYMMAGNKDKAKQSYQKAAQLSPTNTKLKQKIAQAEK